MKKVLCALLLALSISSMTISQAFAEFVYVTKSGKKYHHAESKFVQGKDGVEKITLEEAEDRGLEPSKAFLKHKADLEAEDASKEVKK